MAGQHTERGHRLYCALIGGAGLALLAGVSFTAGPVNLHLFLCLVVINILTRQFHFPFRPGLIVSLNSAPRVAAILLLGPVPAAGAMLLAYGVYLTSQGRLPWRPDHRWQTFFNLGAVSLTTLLGGWLTGITAPIIGLGLSPPALLWHVTWTYVAVKLLVEGTILVRHRLLDPRHFREFRRYFAQASAAAVVGLPLAALLVVAWLSGQPLLFYLVAVVVVMSSLTMKLLGRTARQLRRANRALRERVDHLATLEQASHDIGLVVDTHELFARVARYCAPIIDTSNMRIALHARERQQVTVEYFVQEWEEQEPIQFPMGRGLTSHVLATKRTLCLSDFEREVAALGIEPLYEGFQARSWLGVPMIAEGEALGMMMFQSRKPRAFSKTQQAVLETLAGQIAMAIKNAQLHEGLRESILRTIIFIAKVLDAKDPYTHGHSQRVAKYAYHLGKELDVRGKSLELLRLAGLLHDIGKITISDRILYKPGPLTSQEFTVMKTHPMKGAELLANLAIEGIQDVVAGVRHHHESFDGQGYPKGLRGEAIPLAARVVMVADTLDSMLTDRPYRRSCSLKDTTRELQKHAGAQFDPAVIDAYLRLSEREGHPHQWLEPVPFQIRQFEEFVSREG